MMKKSLALILVLAACVGMFAGCKKKTDPDWTDAPLTVEEWRQIPDDEVKYSPRIMERLKKAGVDTESLKDRSEG